MRRRSQQRRPTSSLRWLVWLGGFLLILGAVLVLALPSLVAGYIQRFLRSDAFPALVEKQLESRFGGHASIASPVWQNDAATSSDVDIETAAGWQIAARELRAALDFGAIRRGAWHIQSAGADEITLSRIPASPKESSHQAEHAGADLPSWISRYIPTVTEVDGFDCDRFGLTHGAWQLAESRLHLSSYSSATTSPGRFTIPGQLSGGTLRTPVTPPSQKQPLQLEIVSATLRLADDKIQITDSSLRWKDRAKASMHGSVRFGSDWQATVKATQVPVSEFLAEAWQSSLSGQLEGQTDFTGGAGRPMTWQADVALKDGVLSTLPILEKLATYTRMERFKRLSLDIATATVKPHPGGGTQLEKIIVQSNGLLRIEGSLTLLPGDQIAGDFMVGVTSEALRWIPGAESRIFIETHPSGPPGLHWTRVKIAGSVQSPQEDLSARLIGAAGMSLVLDTPAAALNKATDTLLKPILGEDAAKLPSKALEDAAKTGTDLLNKVVPIFGK